MRTTEDNTTGRSNAGPPPTWDGVSEAFRDYEIRAKLWLATTKVRPQARRPLLLMNLSSTPFDDLKHLARDPLWMQSSTNGEELLQEMATKELYGEDEREEMINTLAKLTYTLRRQKNEDDGPRAWQGQRPELQGRGRRVWPEATESTEILAAGSTRKLTMAASRPGAPTRCRSSC